MKVSKELFETVMGCRYDTFELSKDLIRANEMQYGTRITYNNFFFKCKEWALNKGYILVSRHRKRFEDLCTIRTERNSEFITHCFADSEQQAVFDACAWILENK